MLHADDKAAPRSCPPLTGSTVLHIGMFGVELIKEIVDLEIDLRRFHDLIVHAEITDPVRRLRESVVHGARTVDHGACHQGCVKSPILVIHTDIPLMRRQITIDIDAALFGLTNMRVRIAKACTHRIKI